MNTTKNEINEAIALAKAVRQTALANAKVSLEEQFNEEYKSLFAKKLKEETDKENTQLSPPPEEIKLSNQDDAINESDIDALIKELESDISNDAGAPSSEPDPTPSATEPTAPTATDAAPVVIQNATVTINPAPDASASGASTDMTSDASSSSASTEPSSALPPSGKPSDEMDEEINLDELLESLKKELEDSDEDEECKLDEDKKLSSSGIGGKTGGSDNKAPSASAHDSSKLESGGITNNGIPESKKINDDATEAARPNQAKNATSTNLSTPSKGGETGMALKAARPNSKGEFENTAKLNEEVAAKNLIIREQSDAINYLKNELNEINLLNAKLLYTNKLFKEHSINVDQKMKIVEMFDLSKTIREVKMTFANIAESLSFSGTSTKKAPVKTVAQSKVQAITEGLVTGVVGSTKPSREIISETVLGRARFMELAGIKPQPVKK